MPKILNTTAKPYNLAISFKDVNDILRNKPFHLIPGESKEVSDKDLEQLRNQKGFKRYEEQGVLVVSGEKKAEAPSGPSISAKARELAEANGIELEDVEPNKNGSITVDMVKALIAEKNDESNGEEPDDEDL